MTQYLVEKYGKDLASVSIEVKVTDNKGVYMLPDSSILRNCTAVGMILPDNSDNTAVAPVSQRNLVSNEILRTSFITLKDVNNEVYEKHPLSDFLTAIQAGDVRLLLLKGFNPQKSFIEISSPSLAAQAATGDESFVLTFLHLNK